MPLHVKAGLRKQVEEADTDLLREMMRLMAGMLMDAEVAAICGAEYRERSEEHVNPGNGHRQRPWDTRVGSMARGTSDWRST